MPKYRVVTCIVAVDDEGYQIPPAYTTPEAFMALSPYEECVTGFCVYDDETGAVCPSCPEVYNTPQEAYYAMVDNCTSPEVKRLGEFITRTSRIGDLTATLETQMPSSLEEALRIYVLTALWHMDEDKKKELLTNIIGKAEYQA